METTTPGASRPMPAAEPHSYSTYEKKERRQGRLPIRLC